MICAAISQITASISSRIDRFGDGLAHVRERRKFVDLFAKAHRAVLRAPVRLRRVRQSIRANPFRRGPMMKPFRLDIHGANLVALTNKRDGSQ